MNTLTLANRIIGRFHRTFVIAEIGVNHDGSLRRALELVDLAAACGADAVKLQLFKANTLMHASSSFAKYQSNAVSDASPVDMLRRYELPADAVATVVNAIRKKGLAPIATPFSPTDVDTIEQLRLPAIKLASPDLVNHVLLRRAAKAGVPMLLSTGAATIEEVRATANLLSNGFPPFALLHCVSSYPTTPANVNLCWIDELNQFGVPVGYSDHSTHVCTGAMAVMAGACIVEKHLTYDRTAKGPDHAASADPREFAEYIKQIRLAETLRGQRGKHVLDCEQDVRNVSRQSLVAARALEDGQMICETDLTVQRPGSGISASEINRLIGQRVCGSVPCGTMLNWSMIRDAA